MHEVVPDTIFNLGYKYRRDIGLIEPSYAYYLRRHIQLDEEEAGHDHMIGELPVDDRVGTFYRRRLALYRRIV